MTGQELSEQGGCTCTEMGYGERDPQVDCPTHGTSPEQSSAMPVFAIKAQDNLAVEAVHYYRELCYRHGLREQGDQVHLAMREIQQWRVDHPDECKWPDHKHVPAGSRS